MFNKITNKKLTITFAALLAIVAIVIIIDNTSKESTFDQDIVEIDTTRVSKIILYPKTQSHKEVILIKRSNDWKVQIARNEYKYVPEEKIRELLKQVTNIKPIRLAAKNENKWKEYQVDTSGTRVEVYEGTDKSLDVIIGKFTFQQPRNMTTYVRLMNDNNVYAVDGFLELVFNKTAASFRNENLVNTDSDDLMKITLNYKPDSSFVLAKVNNKWIINNQPIDSAKAANYIRKLSNLSSTEFENDIKLNSQPAASLKIETQSNKNFELTIYRQGYSYYVKSSLNKDEIFKGDKIFTDLLEIIL